MKMLVLMIKSPSNDRKSSRTEQIYVISRQTYIHSQPQISRLFGKYTRTPHGHIQTWSIHFNFILLTGHAEASRYWPEPSDEFWGVSSCGVRQPSQTNWRAAAVCQFGGGPSRPPSFLQPPRALAPASSPSTSAPTAQQTLRTSAGFSGFRSLPRALYHPKRRVRALRPASPSLAVCRPGAADVRWLPGVSTLFPGVLLRHFVTESGSEQRHVLPRPPQPSSICPWVHGTTPSRPSGAEGDNCPQHHPDSTSAVWSATAQPSAVRLPSAGSGRLQTCTHSSSCWTCWSSSRQRGQPTLLSRRNSKVSVTNDLKLIHRVYPTPPTPLPSWVEGYYLPACLSLCLSVWTLNDVTTITSTMFHALISSYDIDS